METTKKAFPKIVEVQPTNQTTSMVLPVHDNLTASDHPPTYAQAIAKKEKEINFE